jgi:hypothetical protein
MAQRQAALKKMEKELIIVDFTTEVITPEHATSILENMTCNRKVRDRHVTRLAHMMRDGEWHDDAGDPIRFGSDNQLLDGQHRLWAIVQSGIPRRMVVLRGIQTGTMAVLDTGVRRTLADYLGMQGEHYYKTLAGTLSFLWNYEITGTLDGSTDWHKDTKSFSIGRGLELLDRNPGIRDSLLPGTLLSRHMHGGPARWAAIHYTLFQVDPLDAAVFANMLVTGEGIPAGSPVSLLRQRLLQNITSMTKLPTREYTALVLKSWNLWRRGLDVKLLSYKPGGAYPEAYPIPI